MSLKALEQFLEILNPFFEMENVTEICINNPGEIYLEQNRIFRKYELPDLNYDFLKIFATLVAEYNHKELRSPLLSGSLPNGARIQFVMNPACEINKIICSIRCHQFRDFKLEQYHSSFENIETQQNTAEELLVLYEQKEYLKFLEIAILRKKNILISGGTGTGKTTFLNACLKCIPEYERLITVEDTREVVAMQPNVSHLLFNEEDERINALNIFKACLRLRPDRILLSELRGNEIWPYLRSANSGHPGSLSTVHADSVEGSFGQLMFMMQQAGSRSEESEIRNYIKTIIDIVIQLKRDPKNNQHTVISEIYFKESDASNSR